MARPKKEGLDYFPLDVDIDQDDKVIIIIAKYGMEGFGVLIKLLMEVYKHGYFYNWTEKEQLIFSSRVNVNINSVNDIVNDCIKWGLFNETMYKQHKILTSKGIQQRFMLATSRRLDVSIIEEYRLIEVNVNINSKSVGVNDNINPQSKVKESKEKVKESKVKDLIPYVEIITYLNTKTSSSYKPASKKTKEFIQARWNEGFTLEDFKKVIDIKTDEWINDSKMVKFLRPETLFSNKFEGYLNQKTGQAKGQWQQMTEKTERDEEMFGNKVSDYEYDENELEF